MSDQFTNAAMLVSLGWLWLGAGAVVAALFLGWGIDRVDPNARGAYVFRVLLVPGILLIWPLVLWRWGVLEAGSDAWHRRHRPPRTAHGRIWAVLALALPAILLGALAVRQGGPSERAAERLEAPR